MSKVHLATKIATDNECASEIRQGQRFEFGQNWSQFLAVIDERRIKLAVQSLQAMLEVETLQGQRFLDIGSGSGLFSLAARRLGATVHSFDYDPQAVACANELKRQYFPGDPDWTIEQGSALDQDYLTSLGTFNIVYSWGVLHHTGAMWRALENASSLVAPDGTLFIAIYNDQGRASRYWKRVKQGYNLLPPSWRFLILWPACAFLWLPAMVRDLCTGKPFATWRTYAIRSRRGMSAWRDVVDWVGGYPFEVAKPEKIFAFFRSRGFQLKKLTTTQDIGCNEFVFAKA